MLYTWLFFFRTSDGRSSCSQVRNVATEAEARKHLTPYVLANIHNVQRVTSQI